MTDLANLGQAAAGFGILFGGLYGGWQARRSNQNAKDAKVEAAKAAEHAYPISNGWGTALRDDIARTLRAVERISEAQVLSERRELARDDRLRSIDERLDAHLDQHARESAV